MKKETIQDIIGLGISYLGLFILTLYYMEIFTI